jgi:peptide-methionine (S)-S-oxide reductase
MSETTNAPNAIHTAIFAAGCFWGVEAAFRQRLGKGVVSTEVGYIGGSASHPTYKQVCTGATGHAEAVRIQFDPKLITYEDLLNIFWSCHDPTQLDRQGPDVGTQYRSGIFYLDDAQRDAIEKSKEQLEASGKFTRPIVTHITPATHFWPAEEYHQQYLEKNGMAACPTSQQGGR